MLPFLSRTAFAVVLCGVSNAAMAQSAALPTQPAVAVSAEPAPVTPAPTQIRLPALTVVELKLLQEISSKTAISGQSVRLALASPLYVTSSLGLPAGTPVEGMVIHAAKGGMGGKSGELLLAANRIALSPSVEIPLRSFKLGPAQGKNNEGIAFATAVAVGFPSLFITGGSARVPADTVANAKTRADVEIPMALLSTLPPLTVIPAQPAGANAAPSQPQTSTQGN